jgi:hypothetical protein
MANEELTSLSQAKPWKYKLGYVRLTIHSDNPDELVSEWSTLTRGIESMGERVERVSD